MSRGRAFERYVRDRIENMSKLVCERERRVIGKSGSVWEVDGILFDGDEPVAYLEFKHIGGRSSYETQYKLAFSQMADFVYAKIPGAVIVPEKRKPGNKRWENFFATIGCVLIGEDELGDFVDALQSFPTNPETNDPLQNFISGDVWENSGTEQLRVPDRKWSGSTD